MRTRSSLLFYYKQLNLVKWKNLLCDLSTKFCSYKLVTCSLQRVPIIKTLIYLSNKMRDRYILEYTVIEVAEHHVQWKWFAARVRLNDHLNLQIWRLWISSLGTFSKIPNRPPSNVNGDKLNNFCKTFIYFYSLNCNLIIIALLHCLW